jgi:hypothetical protein
VEIITAELVNVMNQPEGLTPEFDALWDATLQKLEQHQEEILEKCSLPIKKFIKEINLFNCPIHSRSINFFTDEYPLVVGQPQEKVYSLSYEVIDRPKIIYHDGAGFDKNEKACWLYDEFHRVENHYIHNVLFSDGMEMQIPFVFFYFRQQSWFEE